MHHPRAHPASRCELCHHGALDSSPGHGLQPSEPQVVPHRVLLLRCHFACHTSDWGRIRRHCCRDKWGPAEGRTHYAWGYRVSDGWVSSVAVAILHADESAVTITVYALFAAEFFSRFLANRPIPGRDLTRGYLTTKLKLLSGALVFSTTCLFIRSVLCCWICFWIYNLVLQSCVPNH